MVERDLQGHQRPGVASLQPLSFRTATPEDEEALFRLISSHAFNPDGTGALLPLSRSAIGATIEQGSFFVAECDSVLAGCSSVVEYNGIAELRSLVVAPEFRGRGASRTLMQKCLEKAAEMGHSVLYALTNEEALPAFLTEGFSRTDTPPQKLLKDCQHCPLNSNELCKEMAVAIKL